MASSIYGHIFTCSRDQHVDIFWGGITQHTTCWDCGAPTSIPRAQTSGKGRSQAGQGRLGVSCIRQEGPRGAGREGGESRGSTPTGLQSRPGSGWGYVHRFVPRRAELLLSSKNTTSSLNKHRGSCEIKQQHEKPGKGARRFRSASRSGQLPRLEQPKPFPKSSWISRPRSGSGQGPVPGPGGAGWEETLEKENKQTLVACLGGEGKPSHTPCSIL